MRQLRTWVRLLGNLFRSLDDDARKALDDVTQACTFLDQGGEGRGGEKALGALGDSDNSGCLGSRAVTTEYVC